MSVCMFDRQHSQLSELWQRQDRQTTQMSDANCILWVKGKLHLVQQLCRKQMTIKHLKALTYHKDVNRKPGNKTVYLHIDIEKNLHLKNKAV